MSDWPPEWTNDCQGKKSYDGAMVWLDTRYWPRGGGFTLIDREKGTWEDNDARPEIKPSAHATIYVGSAEVCEQDFEGETEQEVKRQVEEWAQAQMAKVEQAVRKALTGRE